MGCDYNEAMTQSSLVFVTTVCPHELANEMIDGVDEKTTQCVEYERE